VTAREDIWRQPEPETAAPLSGIALHAASIVLRRQQPGTSTPAAAWCREDNAMPVREGPPQPPAEHKMPPVDGPVLYPAEKARGAEIVLHTPARRFILIAGLAGAVVLGLLLQLLA
jgi:hypothetical protein